MSRLLAYVAAALIFGAPAALSQQQAADEETPRRAGQRTIDRAVAMQRPTSGPGAEDETANEPSPVNQESRRFQMISNAAFDARISAGELNVGGRWACGCSGGEGDCRAVMTGGSLSCYPSEGGGCSGDCELSTTHDPLMSAPASRAGD